MTEATGSATEAGSSAEGQQQQTGAEQQGGQQTAQTGQQQTQQTQAPAIPENWKDALPEDLRGHSALKDITDIHGLAKSYVHAQQMVGSDKVAIPAEGDEQGFKEAMRKLGAPADANGYKDVVKLPENGDENMTSWALSTFADAGLTPQQAQTVIDKWEEMQTQAQDSYQRQSQEQADADMRKLREEWGNAYDQKVEQAKKAARNFADGDQLDELEKKIGTGSLLRMFANIGEKLGEDGHHGASERQFALTPTEAKSSIESFKADRNKMAAYLDKKNPGHQAAVAEMSRLQQAAAGYRTNG